MDTQRSEYIQSLDQLMTTSCILAGFAFSGLISLPGIEKELFYKIVDYFRGDFSLGFYVSFYALFFATLCFLKTIMTILIYKANNYKIPIYKLKRVHLVSNMVFSMAIASLLISVVTFGVPHIWGVVGAFVIGAGVAGSFI